MRRLVGASGFALLATGGIPDPAWAASASPVGSWAWGSSLHASGIPLTPAQLSYLQAQQQIATGAVPAQALSAAQVAKLKEMLSRPLHGAVLLPGASGGEAARLAAARNSDATSLHGSLPNSSAANYLRWKRGLNPSGFDQGHPALGAALAKDLSNRALASAAHDAPPIAAGAVSAATAPSTAAASAGATPRYAAPVVYAHYVNGPAAAVPEPSAWALMIVGCTSLAARWFRRLSRSGAGGEA